MENIWNLRGKRRGNNERKGEKKSTEMNFQREWESGRGVKKRGVFYFYFRDEGNVRRRGIPWNSALSERERKERKYGNRKNSKKGRKKRKWTE